MSVPWRRRRTVDRNIGHLHGITWDELFELLSSIVHMPLVTERTQKALFMHADQRPELPQAAKPTFDYFRDVFSWIPLNPSKPGNSAAIREAFLEGSDSTAENPPLPSRAGLEALYSDLQDSATRVIYLIGSRGCGKTACMNYFLSENHERLNLDGMTWFRTDIAKIYEARSEKLTIEQYHRAHCIYIAIKYSHQDKLLGAFQLCDDGAAENCDFFRRLLDQPDSAEIRDCWLEIVRIFKRSASSVDFVIRVVRGFERDDKRTDYELLFAEMLAEITHSRDGKTRQVIQILDGVDNVDRINASDLYRTFLEQLGAQIGISEKQGPFAKTIVILRKETLHDLLAVSSEVQRVSSSGRKRRERVIQPVDAMQLVLRKLSIIRNPKSDYFKKKKDAATHIKGYDESCERMFEKFVEIYFTRLGRVCDAPNREPNRSAEVLDRLFNHNLRSLCLNVIATYQYVVAFVKITQMAGVNPSGQVVEEALKSSSRLVLEGSITGGEAVMPIHAPLYDDESRWCPNLFDFPYNDSVLRWEGLCLYRALQYFQSLTEKGGRVEGALREHLANTLKYSADSIDQALQLGWRYGLWNVVNHSGRGAAREPVLALSSKGRFLLRAVFLDPAITYFMATATLLHSNHFGSQLWRLHETQPGKLRGFVPSLVKSGLTMMRYVRSAHLYEARNDFLPEPKTHWEPAMELHEWRESMCRYIAIFSQQDKQLAQQLIQDLRGIAPEKH
jgi:hypothetical protein